MCASVPDNCRYPTVRRRARRARGLRGLTRGGASASTLDPATADPPDLGQQGGGVPPAAPGRSIPTRRTAASIFPDPGYSVYYRGAVLAGGEPIPQRLSGDFVQRIWELPDDVLAPHADGVDQHPAQPLRRGDEREPICAAPGRSAASTTSCSCRTSATSTPGSTRRRRRCCRSRTRACSPSSASPSAAA